MTSSLELERDLRPLSETEAEVYIASTCFKTGPPGPVGVEIERILHDASDPRRRIPVTEVRAAVDPSGDMLPHGGVVTCEPGGQLEVSSACHADLPSVVDSMRADVRTVERLVEEAGLEFSPLALDGFRSPVRTLYESRYAAMEQHFDRAGSAGRTMMCSTASLQVCLDAGLPGAGSQSAVQRWARLHDLAPVLTAMFANSPFRQGAPSGWRSTRQGVWLATDPSRTAPVAVTEDPPAAWAQYALNALVLCIPASDGSWNAPNGLTMREWLQGGGPRPATFQDVEYHLTTLFPFIRPRGFLEIRVIDTQAGHDWETAAAVTTALIEDEKAADLAAAACAPVVASLSQPMATAARDAMSDPVLAQAAVACANAAMDALDRSGVDRETRSRVAAFIERHTQRGRCPADDRLDLWRRTGRLLDPSPTREEVR